jgi:hypothetical protein
MTNHEVIYGFSLDTKCSWRDIVKFLKMEISKVITHEQWALTSFLSSGSLELILVNFPSILELLIINYELITNYQRFTN